MVWYIIGGIALAIAVVLLVLNFIRDRRYERTRVLEAMGPDLRKEIEEERAASFERKEKFQGAMDEAMERNGERDTVPHDAIP